MEDGAFGQNGARGDERGGPEGTTLADGDGFAEERENGVSVIVGACAEVDHWADFGVVADGYLA